MGISFDPSFFMYEITVAVSYVPIVALLSVVPLLGGLILGGALALSRVYRLPFVRNAAQAYVVVMRSIPVLLQMLLLYYMVKGVYTAFNWDHSGINKVVVVLLALTLSAAGILSEGLRSALLSVETGQYEACYSVGMTRLHSIRHVILPQSLPVAVPVVGSAFIGIIKGSSAAYLMGVIEMIQGTAMKTAGNYKYLEAYCAVALIYWLMTLLVERVTRWLEGWVRAHIRGGVA